MPCLLSAEPCCGLAKQSLPGPGADELYSTDHHNVADGIDGAAEGLHWCSTPSRARSLARRSLATSDGRSWPLRVSRRRRHDGFDPEQQRRDQEIEAARVSHLFASTNGARRVRPPLRLRRRGPQPPHRSDTGERRRLCAERPGQQTCLRQRIRGSPYSKPGPRHEAGFTVYRAGWDCYSGSPDHRDPIRSSRPDHGAGDRKCFTTRRPVAFCSSRRELV